MKSAGSGSDYDDTNKSHKRDSSNVVYFYWPNIIGYVRVLLLLVGILIAPTEKEVHMGWRVPLFISMYTVSQILDAFDGWVARKLNQATRFGAVLDQVTDRCSTASMIILVGHLYHQYILVFVLWMCLDLSSHWLHMYTSVYLGFDSHKTVPIEKRVLRLYYHVKGVMLLLHVSTELLLVSLYVFYHTKRMNDASPKVINWNSVSQLLIWTSLIPAILKQVVHFVQLTDSAKSLVQEDYKRKSDSSKSTTGTKATN
eukprot:Filipodium_phascolosomae@DN495_c0_g1_i1.p1